MRISLGTLVLIMLFFKEGESSENRGKGKGEGKETGKKIGRPPRHAQFIQDPTDPRALEVESMYDGLGSGLSTKSVVMLDRRKKYLKARKQSRTEGQDPQTLHPDADLQPSRPNEGILIHEIGQGQEQPQHQTVRIEAYPPQSGYAMNNIIASSSALNSLGNLEEGRIEGKETGKRIGRPSRLSQIIQDSTDTQALDLASMYDGLGSGLSTKSVNMLDRRKKYFKAKEQLRTIGQDLKTLHPDADSQPSRPNQGIILHEIGQGQEPPQHQPVPIEAHSLESGYAMANLIASSNALSIAPVRAPRNSFHPVPTGVRPAPPDWGTPGMTRTLEKRKNRQKYGKSPNRSTEGTHSVEPAFGEIAKDRFIPALSSTHSITSSPNYVTNFDIPDPSLHEAWLQADWPNHVQQQPLLPDSHYQSLLSQQQQILHEMQHQAWLIHQQRQQEIFQHQQYLALLNQQQPFVNQQEQQNQNQQIGAPFDHNLYNPDGRHTPGGHSNPNYWGLGKSRVPDFRVPFTCNRN